MRIMMLLAIFTTVSGCSHPECLYMTCVSVISDNTSTVKVVK